MLILLGELPHSARSSRDKHWSLRVCSCVSSFGTFLIFGFYTAVLTSYITALEAPKEFQGLSDILGSDYQLLIWRGTIAEDTFAKVNGKGGGMMLKSLGLVAK